MVPVLRMDDSDIGISLVSGCVYKSQQTAKGDGLMTHPMTSDEIQSNSYTIAQ